ncbi:integrin-linked kinase-associated serine/threonine phosphatase 2C-like [Acipenser oxyrinchus oxyrinchus]|uniref:Integrin-linked kinase-associated serine/threonine phosphatase 2C-like n=1 Tax=Acipenser oxyrinchus oxyrinchus TaxID=40147 RepID=A0AAD8D5U1_ACIOX|nr:integrin-linked kinase-associated serine/threonine phosphatase 2C-like [Acipenser oxyrinchus oxyrinchus]
MDLFDDLPEPAQRTAAVTGPELSSRDGGKRKAQGENGAEEQELVEKKEPPGSSVLWQLGRGSGRICRVHTFSSTTFLPRSLHCQPGCKYSLFTFTTEKMVKKSLLDSFEQTDDFLKQASSQKPAWKNGSMATCVLVVDDVLFIANLGDSRIVLCRAGGEGSKKMSARSTTPLSMRRG